MLKFRQSEAQTPIQVFQNPAPLPAQATTNTLHAQAKLPPAINNISQKTVVTPITSGKRRRFPIQKNTILFPNVLNVIIRTLQKIQKIAQSIKKNPMRAYIWVVVICIALEIFQRGQYALVQNGTLSETVLQKPNIVTLSPDGRYAFTYDAIDASKFVTRNDQRVLRRNQVLNQQYDLVTGKLIREKVLNYPWSGNMKFSRDSKTFALSVSDSINNTEGWQIYNTETMQVKNIIPQKIVSNKDYTKIEDISNEGNIVLLKNKNQLYIWNAKNPNQTTLFQPKATKGEIVMEDSLVSPVLSPDGQWLATLSRTKINSKELVFHSNDRGILTVFNITNQTRHVFDVEDHIYDSNFSVTGRNLFFTNDSKHIIFNGIDTNKNRSREHYFIWDKYALRKWSLDSGKLAFEVVSVYGNDGMHISQDGKFLSQYNDGKDQIIDTSTGMKIMEIPCESYYTNEKAPFFSADNQYLYRLRTHWSKRWDWEQKKIVDDVTTVLSRQRVFLP
jgi:hypothetical protein